MSKGKPFKAAVKGAKIVGWHHKQCFDHIVFRHSWVRSQLKGFVDKHMTPEHLVVYLWSKPHAVVVENMSRKETNTISFPI